ncbi:sulfate adenylyltransferase subunit 1 [Opitutus terrae]|uniref:sulfate adenylyltransferase n=1 Tax=Opitutus terrae (strain DSM 11246 / JCM 15787 / PB90-1) TaxID=452637 RepID=B1ZZN2_OPITP|nr:GTP-binding protein [Opitutus terrae]ACB77218.1 sulfate adenylyltransferase, large subunit [Opitutus terrae PB90-1]
MLSTLNAQLSTTPAPDLLRFITCGNVDDGKSTLLGRLLYDTKSIFEDQWNAVERASARRGDAYTDLALLTDGLRAEREQGITIDVAHRYFATPRRRFIVADCPGHFQYTRNMVTGASAAQLALLLIDVRKGLTEQTCRHAFISTLLRIKHLIVCVNKMDLVDFRQEEFERVRNQFMAYAERLDAADIQFIPTAALPGDNIVTKSPRMPWFEGTPLLYTLETVYVRNDANHVDPRFPVQTVIRPQDPAAPDFRGLAGQVASGVFRPGEEVVHLPTGFTARIKAIHGPSGPVDSAFHPMSVVLELDRDLDIGRGDMLARPNNMPEATQDLEVMLCWLSEQPLDPARRYVLQHTTRETKCLVRAVRYRLDVTTLHRQSDAGGAAVQMNDFARVSLRTMAPVFRDSYKKNRQTGAVILVDEASNSTVAAGMIL